MLKKNMFFNVAILALSLGIFWGVFELVLRVGKLQPGLGTARDLYIKDDKVGAKLRPNFDGTNIEGEYRERITTNANGFRAQRDFSFKKQAGVTRVAVLGDSFTEGTGVNNGETFPDVMQANLGPKFEVINMGVGNYGTVNEVAFLKQYGFAYDPDIVIVAIFVGNDIVNNNTRLSLGDDQAKNPTLAGEKRMGIQIKNMAHDMIKRSYVYQFIAARWHGTMTAIGVRDYYGGKMGYDYMFVKKYSTEVQSGLKYTQFDLEELKQCCRARNVRLILVLIPIKDQVVDATWDKLAAFHPLYDREKPQRILNSLLSANNMEFLDLLPLMRAAKDRAQLYFAKDPHCTASGYRFIGDAISEYLDRSAVESGQNL